MPRRQDQLPVDVIRIGGHDITPAASARNLGVYFDSELSMRRHIYVITERCYASLRQLRTIRRYTSSTVNVGHAVADDVTAWRCRG